MKKLILLSIVILCNFTKANDEKFQKIFIDLKLVDTKKNEIILKELKEPLVVINFWASWCRPCVSEFKSLNNLKDQLGDQITIIGINNDDEEDQIVVIEKTEKKYKLKFNSVADSNLIDNFGFEQIPASVIYHKGKVFRIIKEEFQFDNKEFVEELKRLL
jgi:thiol-disulfide isomerase/thioredoxin